MINVLNILCESGIFDANQIKLAQESVPVQVISVAFLLVLLAGIVFLIYWLANTSFGRTALDDSRPRRNAMAFYIPLIPFGVWVLLSGAAAGILELVSKVISDLDMQLLTLSLSSVMAVTLFVISIIIVRMYFVRGLTGFGIDCRTFGRDLLGAATKLLTVWPLVFGMLWLTIAIGKLIFGPDFEIGQHEELEVLLKYDWWPVRAAVIFLAVVLAPVAEEMLFRGLFQTMFRNVLGRPWVAIVATSMLFSMSHANADHWPALFVLAVGLGYAYEKSGSLVQSIFMHAIFNGVMVAGTLLQV